jgi:hypothetical protein
MESYQPRHYRAHWCPGHLGDLNAAPTSPEMTAVALRCARPLPPLHSITSSARARSVGGTSGPSILVVHCGPARTWTPAQPAGEVGRRISLIVIVRDSRSHAATVGPSKFQRFSPIPGQRALENPLVLGPAASGSIQNWGAELKRRSRRKFLSQVFGAGAKTHFQNPKAPLLRGLQTSLPYRT